MSRMPEKICAYIDWAGTREWYDYTGELHEPGDVEYIRADIVATKNDWLNAQLDAAQTSLTYWRDLCAVTEQALNKTGESLLAKVEEIARLENIIEQMSAREVDGIGE